MNKPKQPRRPDDADLSPFAETLLDALKHFTDTGYLASCSPLTSPYFLGEHLIGAPSTRGPAEAVPISARTRSESLRTLLRRAADQLEGADASLYRAILHAHFFEDLSEVKAADKVGLGKTAFYKHRKRALHALEDALARLIHPTLRLETPVQITPRLWGRDAQIARCLHALLAGQTVNLTGSGGTGKTTLGSYLCERWVRQSEGGRPIFWFTVRPGLTDRLDGLLFALGYFLHTRGAPTLWLELVANSGQIEPDLALNIVRDGLSRLRAADVHPLLCLDEVDLLKPAQDAEHSQVLTFIDSLRWQVPLLLIGQQALIEAHTYCELTGLTRQEAAQLLMEGAEGQERVLSTQEQAELHAYTGGNPRLLHLFATLHSLGESIPALLHELLHALSHAQPMEHLLGRILRRLERSELAVLAQLAVYRSPVSAAVFQHALQESPLQTLLQRQLVQEHKRGEVSLLPAYRTVIYKTLPADKRTLAHRAAAAMRAATGVYTAAAHHYVEAGDAAQAIALWQPKQQQEVNGGQAGAALHIFRQIDATTLSTDARQTLTMLRAHLTRLRGNAAQALADIQTLLEDVDILSAQAQILAGEIANDQGRFEEAETHLQQARVRAEALAGKYLAYIHKGLGWRHMREADLQAAGREAQFARYEVDNLEGYIAELRGDYKDAENYYAAAIALAAQLNHAEGIAKTCYNLSGLYARLGQFDQAKERQRQAEAAAAQIGKIVYLISGKINWAFLYNLAGEYQNAYQALQEAQAEFARFAIPLESWQDALIHQALAEAHLGLHQLDAAERCARRALELEEVAVLPDALRTFGEIMLARGHLAQAQLWIVQSIERAANNGDPYLEGYGWRALARVHAAQGNSETAAEARTRAIELFERLALSNEVVKTITPLQCDPV